MILHLSIPARDTKRVAEVLAEFIGGTTRQSERYPDIWNVDQNDRDGTLIEILPAGVELLPRSAGGPRMGEAREHGPFHFAMSVELSPEAVTAIATREGWEAYLVAEGGLEVIDVWIENATLIQLLPPAFAAKYRAKYGAAEPEGALQPAR